MTTAFILAALVSQEPAAFDQKVPGTAALLKMVPVPGGTVNSQGKDVEVKPFFVSATEVTWDIYDVFVFRLDLNQTEQARGVDAKTRPSRPYGAPDHGFGHKGYPAIGPHSSSAVAFAAWMAKKTGKKYRLLTEAEWEHAATLGGGAPTAFAEHAWMWDTAKDTTHPVGKLKANTLGIHDLFGNVAEWVLAADGTPVVKGGHYLSQAGDISVSFRQPYQPEWQQKDAQMPKSKWWLSDGSMIGLRLACDP